MSMKKFIPNRLAQRISFGIIAIIIAIVCACMFTSCKTPNAVTTKTDTRDSLANEWHNRDSLGVSIRAVHDTVYLHDTIYINEKTVKDAETESETTLHFGEGGGTYNAKTGDATNVTGVGVKESKREHELKERNEKLVSENTFLHHENDSLRSIVQSNDSTSSEVHNDNSESETQQVGMNKHERFMYTSGWIFWGIVAAFLVYFIIKLLRKFKVIPV